MENSPQGMKAQWEGEERRRTAVLCRPYLVARLTNAHDRLALRLEVGLARGARGERVRAAAAAGEAKDRTECRHHLERVEGELGRGERGRSEKEEHAEKHHGCFGCFVGVQFAFERCLLLLVVGGERGAAGQCGEGEGMVTVKKEDEWGRGKSEDDEEMRRVLRRQGIWMTAGRGEHGVGRRADWVCWFGGMCRCS